MKKRILIGVLVLVLGVGSLVAYADTANQPNLPNIYPRERNINFTQEDREVWFKERTEYKREMIKEALEKGFITEDEVKDWEKHLLEMEEFHNNNGFMPGGCGGFGMGFGRGQGKGLGFGRGMGMMRGNRW